MLWSFKFNLLNVFFRFVDFLYRIFIIVGNEASISWLVTLLEVTCILHPWMVYRPEVVSSWSPYQFLNALCLVSTVTVLISFVREAWHHDYHIWTFMRFDVNRIYIIGPGEPLHSTIYYQLYDFQMHGTSLKVRGECGICRLNLFITLNVAWSSIWYSDFIATITCLFRSFIVWSRCYHYDGFNTHALCDVIGVACCIFFQFSMLHCLRLLR